MSKNHKKRYPLTKIERKLARMVVYCKRKYGKESEDGERFCARYEWRRKQRRHTDDRTT